MTFQLSDHVLIQRPPAEVWPCVADLDLDQRWRRPYVVELQADGDPLVPGTTITGTTRALGVTDTYRNEITDVDPPRRLAWRGLEASGGLVGVHGAYELEPRAGTATRFRLTITYEARNLVGRMLSPAMAMFLRRVMRRFMRQVRELAEAT